MVENYRFCAPFDGSVESNLREIGFSGSIITQLRKSKGLVKTDDNSQTALIMPDKIKKDTPLAITLPVEPSSYPRAQTMPDFVYEDEYLAVVNKPPFVATIPVKSHYKDSLASVLANAWGDFVYRPVGRLDKDTSGLIVIAQTALSACILTRSDITKQYLALVEGKLEGSGEIDAPIGLSCDGIHREVSESGKPARTLYESVAFDGNNSLVRFTLLTGRTHQIRVHSAYIGHPLCGDKLYNPCPQGFDRHMLHCARLVFAHPLTEKILEFDDSVNFLKSCGFS